MCKSRAEGGQRCYSHARKALDAALTAAQARREPLQALRALGNRDARLTHRAELALEGRILRTKRELASTPKGREEFQTQADQARANGDYQTFAEVTELIDQGKAIEERNAALAAIARTEQTHKPPTKEDHDRPRLTPTQIREALDQPLTSEQVIRTCEDLGPTLKALHTSVSDRVSATNQEMSGAERHQRTSSFDYAEWWWRRVSRSRYVDYQVAWRQFVDGMRRVRDNPFDSVAFPDQWRRDCNFILRVAGEIAHQHRQWDIDNPGT